MAGQGHKKVRECIAKHGRAFAERPRQRMGIHWCRFCEYQVALHHDALRSAIRLVPQPK